MTKGTKVKVLTSEAFPDLVGIIKEITNQGRITIDFGVGVGVYTLEKNTFQIMPT